ncbi:hypothetical protein H0W91_03040 [Patescibacteria group bacterium]|nr:hypothetical protein [Patescibacteria group bacterium]
MFNVIGDEMYYVGGVLRAMEHHTIIPAHGDVPYGTLTFILNYILTVFYLIILVPFFKFKIILLKLFLVKYPTIMYLSRRVLSSVLAIVMLFVINRLLEKEFQDTKVRLYLLILLFTNIITTLILHTGKMWVLSVLLIIISFYYLYQTLEEKEHNVGSLEKSAFLSILFSFLALSNFPLNFYSLINIPIMISVFRKKREFIVKIVKYTVVCSIIFIGLTLYNFSSIRDQIISIFTLYHPITSGLTKNLNFFQAFYIYFIKTIILFPLLLLTWFIVLKDEIKNKRLFYISGIYFLSYFFLITLVANWSTDIKTDLRYLFPFGFFLIFILSSYDIKFRKIFYALGFISIFFQILILYYLSIPTTYNQAYNWINNNLSTKEVIIVNKVAELQLIKNNSSSNITKDQSCATKCQNIINFDLNSEFKPFVVDLLSEDIDVSNQKVDMYYISETKLTDPSIEMIESFDNPTKYYHSVEYNIGSYFDLELFKLKNFGKNIYIYKKIKTENK